MLIDWPKRCTQIEDKGFTIILQGVAAKSNICAVMSSSQLASVQKNAAVAIQLCYTTDSQQAVDVVCPDLPTEIVNFFLDFEDLFAEPVGLPPVRSCDHKIPLIQGAQPVNNSIFFSTGINRSSKLR